MRLVLMAVLAGIIPSAGAARDSLSTGVRFIRLESAFSWLRPAAQTVPSGDFMAAMRYGTLLDAASHTNRAPFVLASPYRIFDIRFFMVQAQRPRHEWMAGIANGYLNGRWSAPSDRNGNQMYKVRHEAQYMAFQGGWQYQGRPGRRFQWHVGLHGMAGVSVAGKTYLTRETVLPGESTSGTYAYRFFAQPSRLLYAGASAGVKVRIFGKMGFFYEIQPGIIRTTVDGTAVSGRAAWTRSGIFVRLTP